MLIHTQPPQTSARTSRRVSADFGSMHGKETSYSGMFFTVPSMFHSQAWYAQAKLAACPHSRSAPTGRSRLPRCRQRL